MERAFEPGCRFGPLRFERELGRGAFASVWLARDTLLDRLVAVKVLRAAAPAQGAAPDAPDRGDRFLTEARLVGRLKSPHIVTLHGVHALSAEDGWGEGYLLVMEFVEEGTLQDVLDRGERLPPERVRGIFRAVLTALAVAHAHGVVHGDVKPANVLLGRGGEVKLSDFGLASLVGDVASAWSLRGEVAGTPGYMAPEVVQGERATAASDLWAAGVILYRLLAGRLPFEGRTADALFAQIHNSIPASIAEEVPLDLADLADAAMRCLAKHPASRPGSSEALLEGLDHSAAIASRRGPEPDAAPESAAPLVGREVETQRIADLLDSVRKGPAAAASVSGEAGMGKTALLRHAAGLARRRGFHVVELSVTPLRGAVRPLLLALRDSVSEPAAVRGRAASLLTFEDLGRDASAVRRALGDTGVVRPTDRHESAWAAEQILAAATQRRPVAVLLDDAHAADAEEAALLGEVVAHLRDLPFLLLAASRPRDESAASGDAAAPAPLRAVLERAGAVAIDLPSLSQEVLYAILRATARGLRIAPEVVSRILDVAEGNPRLAVELLRHLVQTEAVVERGGSLEAAPSFRTAELPSRFHELVALRIDRLQDEDRAILDVAAVDGVVFDGEAVASVLDRPLLALLRRLQSLARRGGLIVPQAAGYRFAHPVVQEAVYREIAPDLRRATHRRLAEHLESRGDASEAERLGTHWERAGDAGRASPHLLRAALVATGRQEYLRAIDLATRGGLLPDGITAARAVSHAELLFALCGCFSDLGQPERAEQVVARVLDAAEASGDTALHGRALVWREDIRFHARGAEAVDVRALTKTCADLQQSEELGRALFLLGSVAKLRDRLHEATRLLLDAQEVFGALGQRRFLATTTNQLASVALRSGRLAEAETLYAEAAAASAAAGRRTNAAVSTVNGVLASLAHGNVEGLEEPLRGAIRTLECTGATNHAALATVVLAQVLYAAGDAAAATQSAEEALATVERTEFPPGIARARLELARLTAARGELDAARTHLVAARDAVKGFADRDVALDIFAEDVRCAAFSADRKVALTAARAALAAARGGAAAEARTKLSFSLAESALHGLPTEALDEASDLLGSILPGEDPATALTPLLGAAVRELRAGGEAHEALARAAAAVRERPCGERRAELLVLADWLDAESTLRSGDRAEAAKRAEAGARRASALGHVWLEAALLRVLGAAAPGCDDGARLTALLERVDRSLQWDTDRRRLRQAWLEAGPRAGASGA